MVEIRIPRKTRESNLSQQNEKSKQSYNKNPANPAKVSEIPQKTPESPGKSDNSESKLQNSEINCIDSRTVQGSSGHTVVICVKYVGKEYVLPTNEGVLFYRSIDYVYRYKDEDYTLDELPAILKKTGYKPSKTTLLRETELLLSKYRKTVSYDEYFMTHPNAKLVYDKMHNDFESWLKEKYAVFGEVRYPHILLTYISFMSAFIPHYKLHIFNSGRSHSGKTSVQRETKKILSMAFDDDIIDKATVFDTEYWTPKTLLFISRDIHWDGKVIFYDQLDNPDSNDFLRALMSDNNAGREYWGVYNDPNTGGLKHFRFRIKGGNPVINATIVTKKINRFSAQVYNRAFFLIYEKLDHIVPDIRVDITDDDRVAFMYHVLTTPKDPAIPTDVWQYVEAQINKLVAMFPFTNSRITELMDSALRSYAKLLNKDTATMDIVNRFFTLFFKHIVATVAQIDAEDIALLNRERSSETTDQEMERLNNLVNLRLIEPVDDDNDCHISAKDLKGVVHKYKYTDTGKQLLDMIGAKNVTGESLWVIRQDLGVDICDKDAVRNWLLTHGFASNQTDFVLKAFNCEHTIYPENIDALVTALKAIFPEKLTFIELDKVLGDSNYARRMLWKLESDGFLREDYTPDRTKYYYWAK